MDQIDQINEINQILPQAEPVFIAVLERSVSPVRTANPLNRNEKESCSSLRTLERIAIPPERSSL
jgi:hypothetical protein